jgi:putative solute:sodium symporter small subunit
MLDQTDTTDKEVKSLDLHDPKIHAALESYWAKNVFVMVSLLIVWAVAGLGCGVLFADWLNNFTLPGTGFPLGFWFAHQGSIIIFVLLILTYCLTMNRLDNRHHKEIEQIMKKKEHNK